MTVPIRLRLTAWYVAVMLLTLSLFGGGMFVAMHLAIDQTVDRDLRLRLAGVEEFLDSTHRTCPSVVFNMKSENTPECGQAESCCR